MSLVLHVLALTGMVVGLKVTTPPPEERAIELRLIPSFEPRPRPPEPARQAPEQSNTRARPGPRLTPQPAPQVSVAFPPAAPPPAPAATPEPGPKTYGPEDRLAGPSGRRGCDDALGARLTPEERQICVNNLARLTREARQLDSIPADKKAEYDRYADHAAACRKYKQAGVPGKNWVNPKEDMMPDGHASNIDPSFDKNAGIGPGVSGC